MSGGESALAEYRLAAKAKYEAAKSQSATKSEAAKTVTSVVVTSDSRFTTGSTAGSELKQASAQPLIRMSDLVECSAHAPSAKAKCVNCMDKSIEAMYHAIPNCM